MTAEDCAIQIKEIDEYFGYIAWCKIFILQPEKKHLTSEVCVELILKYPTYPESYFTLIHYLHKVKKDP
jgi:hypothetical protein